MVVALLPLYEQIPVGNNGTFKYPKKGNGKGTRWKRCLITFLECLHRLFVLLRGQLCVRVIHQFTAVVDLYILCRKAEFVSGSLNPGFSFALHSNTIHFWCTYPLAVLLSHLRPRFAFDHPRSLRASADPRRASAHRGEAPLLSHTWYLVYMYKVQSAVCTPWQSTA